MLKSFLLLFICTVTSTAVDTEIHISEDHGVDQQKCSTCLTLQYALDQHNGNCMFILEDEKYYNLSFQVHERRQIILNGYREKEIATLFIPTERDKGLFYMSFGSCEIQYMNFVLSNGIGDPVFQFKSDEQLRFKNCKITAKEFTKVQYTFISIQSGQFYADGIIFSNIILSTLQMLHCNQISLFNISNITFMNISGDNGGRCIEVNGINEQGLLQIQDCKFINCSTQKDDYGFILIHSIDGIGEININKSQFKNCAATGNLFPSETIPFNGCGGGLSIINDGEFNDAIRVQLSDCIFDGCSANREGGGIYVSNSQVSFIRCNFSYCNVGLRDINQKQSSMGGAISAISSSINLISSSFHQITSEGHGGAIYTDDCELIVDFSTFSNCSCQLKHNKQKQSRNDDINRLNGHGGTLLGTSSEIRISNSNFTQCTSYGSGSAVAFITDVQSSDSSNIGVLMFEQCVFSKCQSISGGGAIYSEDTKGMKLINCTFYSNKANQKLGNDIFDAQAKNEEIYISKRSIINCSTNSSSPRFIVGNNTILDMLLNVRAQKDYIIYLSVQHGIDVKECLKGKKAIRCATIAYIIQNQISQSYSINLGPGKSEKQIVKNQLIQCQRLQINGWVKQEIYTNEQKHDNNSGQPRSCISLPPREYSFGFAVVNNFLGIDDVTMEISEGKQDENIPCFIYCYRTNGQVKLNRCLFKVNIQNSTTNKYNPVSTIFLMINADCLNLNVCVFQPMVFKGAGCAILISNDDSISPIQQKSSLITNQSPNFTYLIVNECVFYGLRSEKAEGSVLTFQWINKSEFNPILQLFHSSSQQQQYNVISTQLEQSIDNQIRPIQFEYCHFENCSSSQSDFGKTIYVELQNLNTYIVKTSFIMHECEVKQNNYKYFSNDITYDRIELIYIKGIDVEISNSLITSHELNQQDQIRIENNLTNFCSWMDSALHISEANRISINNSRFKNLYQGAIYIHSKSQDQQPTVAQLSKCTFIQNGVGSIVFPNRRKNIQCDGGAIIKVQKLNLNESGQDSRLYGESLWMQGVECDIEIEGSKGELKLKHGFFQPIIGDAILRDMKNNRDQYEIVIIGEMLFPCNITVELCLKHDNDIKEKMIININSIHEATLNVFSEQEGSIQISKTILRKLLQQGKIEQRRMKSSPFKLNLRLNVGNGAHTQWILVRNSQIWIRTLIFALFITLGIGIAIILIILMSIFYKFNCFYQRKKDRTRINAPDIVEEMLDFNESQ